MLIITEKKLKMKMSSELNLKFNCSHTTESQETGRDREDAEPKKKKKRTLPTWMSQHGSSDTKDNVDKKKLQSPGMKLPFLEFKGTTYYSYHQNDCSMLCLDIKEKLNDDADFPVGLDIEWPVTYQPGRESKTALLQLCVSQTECYLFHLACMPGFPSSLKDLLSDPRVIKVGVGIEGDLWKLERDFGFLAKPLLEGSTVDLATKACVILNTKERWSLDGLTKHLLGHQLNKDPVVRKSDWSQYPLTEQQKQYAAIDAYASLEIYNELKKREKNSSQQLSTNSENQNK